MILIIFTALLTLIVFALGLVFGLYLDKFSPKAKSDKVIVKASATKTDKPEFVVTQLIKPGDKPLLVESKRKRKGRIKEHGLIHVEDTGAVMEYQSTAQMQKEEKGTSKAERKILKDHNLL